MPKMRHLKSTKTIDVAPAQVALYESQGWQTSTPKKKPSAQTTTTAPAAATKE